MANPLIALCRCSLNRSFCRPCASTLLAPHPTCHATQINTSNLERVRRIKNRMVRLTTRVETLREVLEKFLDDDSDMKDLNLTAKVRGRVGRRQEAQPGTCTLHAHVCGPDTATILITPWCSWLRIASPRLSGSPTPASCLSLPLHQEEERLELFNRHVRSGAATPFDVPLPYTGASGAEVRCLAACKCSQMLQRAAFTPLDVFCLYSCTSRTCLSLLLPVSQLLPVPVTLLAQMQPTALDAMTPMTPKSASSASSDSTDLEDDPDVAVVEMLMEPYFMQVCERRIWVAARRACATGPLLCVFVHMLAASTLLTSPSAPCLSTRPRSTTPTTSCRLCASTLMTQRCVTGC